MQCSDWYQTLKQVWWLYVNFVWAKWLSCLVVVGNESYNIFCDIYCVYMPNLNDESVYPRADSNWLTQVLDKANLEIVLKIFLIKIFKLGVTK